MSSIFDGTLPDPGPWFWQWGFENSDGQTYLAEQEKVSLLPNHLSRYSLSAHSSSFVTSANVRPPVRGDTGTLLVVVTNGFIVLEGQTVPVVFDDTVGLGFQAWALSTSSGGGFTADDRTVLLSTQSNTFVRIPSAAAIGGLVLRGLGELAGPLPPYIFSRHASQLISGDGSFQLGVGNMPSDCRGIEWVFTTVPPGFGFASGVAREWQRRIVQWVPVFRDPSGSEFRYLLTDSDFDSQRLTWALTQPQLLGFSVAPGCEVTVIFLTLIP